LSLCFCTGSVDVDIGASSASALEIAADVNAVSAYGRVSVADVL
jgi:hypothetical protein